jgi:hypothetical protein
MRCKWPLLTAYDRTASCSFDPHSPGGSGDGEWGWRRSRRLRRLTPSPTPSPIKGEGLQRALPRLDANSRRLDANSRGLDTNSRGGAFSPRCAGRLALTNDRTASRSFEPLSPCGRGDGERRWRRSRRLRRLTLSPTPSPIKERALPRLDANSRRLDANSRGLDTNSRGGAFSPRCAGRLTLTNDRTASRSFEPLSPCGRGDGERGWRRSRRLRRLPGFPTFQDEEHFRCPPGAPCASCM